MNTGIKSSMQNNNNRVNQLEFKKQVCLLDSC